MPTPCSTVFLFVGLFPAAAPERTSPPPAADARKPPADARKPPADARKPPLPPPEAPPKKKAARKPLAARPAPTPAPTSATGTARKDARPAERPSVKKRKRKIPLVRMPGPFLSVGGTVAGAFGGPYSGDNTRGLVAGGEFSLIWGWDGGRIPIFFGPFAEGLYDWHRKGGRATVGGVVGILIPTQIRGQSVVVPLGVDGGYAMDFAGKMKHGLSVRIFLFIGPIGPYVRYVALKDDPDYSEVGVMIKLPIPLYR